MTLTQAIEQIRPLDRKSMEISAKNWDNIAKPLHSLGKMENLITRIAGIQGTPNVDISKRILVPMCADNGIVEEGVTQSGQEVTRLVSEEFLTGETSSCLMASYAHVDVMPVDVGIVTDTKVRTDLKVMYGTNNFTKGPAMSREQAVKGLEAGIHMVGELKEKGYKMFVTGEMGIGNTTTSSAIASVLLGEQVERMTGRGAGLSSEGLNLKIKAIKKGIELNQPDPKDAIDVLAKVGGLDIAGIAGIFIGGAAYRCPVLIDGFISLVGALVAMSICPQTKDFMIATHVSKEPATGLILDYMGLDPVIHGNMCLGEGTGALTLVPFLDMGMEVYTKMGDFDNLGIDAYQELV